jgi:subtilisin family serine protease
MTRKHLHAGLFFLIVASGACSDGALVEPESPGSETNLPVLSDGASVFALDSEPQPRHLVVLKNKARGGFEQAVEELGGRVIFHHPATGIAGVEGLDDAGAESLRMVDGVSLVEEEPMIYMTEPAEVGIPQRADEPTSPTEPTGAWAYPRQWNMRAIQADEAWAAGRLGSPGVTVAILDTGIGYTHEDLMGRVDLTRSVSFVPEDDFYVGYYFPGAHPIADIGYHGTHVAATVASNGYTAAGVTSQVTLMGIKVCSVVRGGCPGLAIFQGILHATDAGADVANMSFGGWFTKRAYPGYVATLNRLFSYMNQHQVTAVVSAGNDRIDLDRNLVPMEDEEGGMTIYRVPSLFKTYCDAPNVICVSATGPTGSENYRFGPWENVDAPAPYTNFGRSAIDFAAPGGTSHGAVWAACSTFSLLAPICQLDGFALGITGTSMAAPHVTGLAALAVEDVGKNVGRVRNYIIRSADRLGGGKSPFYGKGRINVARAVGF